MCARVDDMNKKQCFKCEQIKPITEFYKHKQMEDGHLGKCKDCAKKDTIERYYSEDGNKKIREYEKKRFKNPKRKEKIKQYRLKRRIKQKEKYQANYTTSNAIRDGKLKRQPCEVCGDQKSQAHHKDYSKPLEVMWLCRKHHLEQHKKECWI